jgi:hypothetical protein
VVFRVETNPACRGVLKTKIYNDPFVHCDACGLKVPWNAPRLNVGGRHDYIPPYSKGIAAAWAVVERLRELGLEIIIGSEPDGWEVEITVTEALAAQGYSGCYSKHAPIAEAICSAALTALRDRASHQPA